MARIDDTPTAGQRLQKEYDPTSQIIDDFGVLIALQPVTVTMTLATRWQAGPSTAVVTYPTYSVMHYSCAEQHW